MQDEISFMWDGSAFQARRPAMERLCQLHEAEYTWDDEVAAHIGPKPGVVTAPDEFCEAVP